DNVAFLAREGSTGSHLNFQNLGAGANNNAKAVSTWNNNGNTPLNSAVALDAGGAAAYGSGTPTAPTNPHALFSASGGVESASNIAGEMHLSQSQLDGMVAVAISYWAAAGLSAAQIAYLQSVQYDIGDLMGGWLGASTPGHVTISTDAAGYGWFVDPTPRDSSEFSNAVASTKLVASPTDASAGHIDLLTTVMHEMGEQLGLVDIYD